MFDQFSTVVSIEWMLFVDDVFRLFGLSFAATIGVVVAIVVVAVIVVVVVVVVIIYCCRRCRRLVCLYCLSLDLYYFFLLIVELLFPY